MQVQFYFTDSFVDHLLGTFDGSGPSLLTLG